MKKRAQKGNPKALEYLKLLQQQQILHGESRAEEYDNFIHMHQEIAMMGLSKRRRRLVRTVPVGWLGCLNPNGITWRFPDGTLLITLSSGLMHLFYMAAKAFCCMCKFEDTPFGESRRNVEFSKSAKAFFDSILHFRTGCLFAPEKDSICRREFWEYGQDYGLANLDMMRLLVVGQVVFVISHEYAHILLGHTGERRKALREYTGLDSDFPDVDIMIRGWAEERAADKLAMELSLSSFSIAGREKLAVRYLDDLWFGIVESSAYYFLLTVQLADILPRCPFDRELELFSFLPDRISDHPPAVQRMLEIGIALAESSVSPDTGELITAFDDFAENVVEESKKGNLAKYIQRKISEFLPDEIRRSNSQA